MKQKQSRWFFLFVLMGLVSVSMFTPKAHADSDWMKFFRKDSLLNTYKTCYAVTEDTLWCGTGGEGVLIKDGTTVKRISNKNTRSTPPLDDGLVSDYITCITIDEMRGRVWIGTNEGLSSCSLEGTEWTRYTENTGLPNNVIRVLTTDNNGNVWVGTPSGIAVFNGETWTFYTEKNGLPQDSIHSIKVKGNSVWVGTVGGAVARFKDGAWKTIADFD